MKQTQFAELNFLTYDALYQDVLTYPGKILDWGFDHGCGGAVPETIMLWCRHKAENQQL